MDRILVGGDIPVTLRRSARARRMTLRVARAGGEVVLTLPSRTSLRDGRAFAESRAEWLRRTRAGMPALQLVDYGTALPVEGRPRLREADLRKHLINEMKDGTEKLVETDAKPDPRFVATPDELKKQGITDFQLDYATRMLSRLGPTPMPAVQTAAAATPGKPTLQK